MNPDIAADEALLPVPPEDIGDWATTAVPTTGSEGYRFGYSGWLSEHTTKRTVNSYTSLDPGAYVVQLACRGDGTITVTMTTLESEPVDAEVQNCSNSTVAFDVTTTETGLSTELTLEGDPTIYAMSFQTAPAS